MNLIKKKYKYFILISVQAIGHQQFNRKSPKNVDASTYWNIVYKYTIISGKS